MVKVGKKLLQGDLQRGLLAYRTTPLAKTLPQLQVGDKFRVGDKRSYTEVTGKCFERPRRYQMRTPGGAIITRNWRNLNRYEGEMLSHMV
jgi:hypothetical protein